MLPGRLLAECIQAAASKVGANHDPDKLQILAVTMDEIIPKGDGMPSATEAGGTEYLQYLSWQYPSIENEIAAFLDTVRQTAPGRLGMQFLSLQHEQRVQLLAYIERHHASSFASFRSYVYEAYYTRPVVQGAFSCLRSEKVAEDLDTLLSPVRNMKPIYREVP
jgi:hypothetical protein